MVEKLKLTEKRLEELLQRVEDEPSLTLDERRLIKEVFEEAIRIGALKVKK
jgi:hypothetical protein